MPATSSPLRFASAGSVDDGQSTLLLIDEGMHETVAAGMLAGA